MWLRKPPFVAFLVVLAFAIVLMAYRELEAWSRRNTCYDLLAQGIIQTACEEGYNMTDKTLPAHLVDFGEAFLGRERSLWWFRCPGRTARCGVGTDTNSWQSIDTWTDYSYVAYTNLSWAVIMKKRYPIMYDKRLCHHGGKGITILLTDGGCLGQESRMASSVCNRTSGVQHLAAN